MSCTCEVIHRETTQHIYLILNEVVLVVVFFADVVTDRETRHVPGDSARTVDFTTRHTRGVVTRIATLARRGTVSFALSRSAARETDIEMFIDVLTVGTEVVGGVVGGGVVVEGEVGSDCDSAMHDVARTPGA